MSGQSETERALAELERLQALMFEQIAAAQRRSKQSLEWVLIASIVIQLAMFGAWGALHR